MLASRGQLTSHQSRPKLDESVLAREIMALEARITVGIALHPPPPPMASSRPTPLDNWTLLADRAAALDVPCKATRVGADSKGKPQRTKPALSPSLDAGRMHNATG